MRPSVAFPRLARVTLLAVAVLAACGVGPSDHGTAGEGTGAKRADRHELSTPFTCDGTAFLSQGDPTQLYSIGFTSVDATLTAIGGVSSYTYNALGYDPVDNYLYASSRDLVSGAPELLRIDATGAVTVWGTMPDLPADNGNEGFLAATIDSTGVYYATTPSGASQYLYELSIATGTATTVAMSLGGEPFEEDILDWTMAAGWLWAVDPSNHDIARIDPVTGAVTEIPQTIFPSGSYGAVWTFGNGNLGFANNATGAIYEIEVGDPSGVAPTLTLVSTFQGASTSNNDGASCPGTPAGGEDAGPPNDAGEDGGGSDASDSGAEDAGEASDAGAGVDASTGADAGTPRDSGVDAAMTGDAAAPVDGAAPSDDSGTSAAGDSGTDASGVEDAGEVSEDGGSSSDSGTPNSDEDAATEPGGSLSNGTGCGCTTVGSSNRGPEGGGSAGLALVALLALRRSRRRAG
jgi:MYXO-CTERM domain-containing protein